MSCSVPVQADLRAKCLALLTMRNGGDEAVAVALEEKIFEENKASVEKYKLAIRNCAAEERRSIPMEDEEDDDANWEKINGLFECKKCKLNHTRHKEKQTRSADEPMTVFVKCFNPTCKASYKFCP